jgi:hypothetical protein
VLVRDGEEERVKRVLIPGPRAAYPAVPDSVVGTLRLKGPAGTLGRVPVLAVDVGPPHAPGGPWWARAGGALARAVTGAIDGLFG